METAKTIDPPRARLGRWLPRDTRHIQAWIRRLKRSVHERPRELVEPIRQFERMVSSDPVLNSNVGMMFAEAFQLKKMTPLGEPEVKSFQEFLVLLNAVMTTAPEAYQTTSSSGELEPAGLIGFPINALLDWPMATLSGYDVFANALVNQQFKKILGYWSRFLVTPESRYVLTQPEEKIDPTTTVIGWLSDTAQAEMVSVATSAVGEGSTFQGTFPQIFNCDPDAPYYGFKSWDDFFIRTFAPGVRPVSAPGDDGVIVNACESAPFTLRKDVALSDEFWLKGQPYSLENMLNWDDYTPQFAGGTVYQAFLSALSYHRWHSPVSGTIRKAYVVSGSYYLESLYQGFGDPQGADAAAPNNSQAFLTAVAARALIFIEADNPAIGLMCVMPIGMAEVSSCEITVKVGQHVDKGEQLGMFHFGGSTHCLVFRPGVNLEFDLYKQKPGPTAETNIRLNTAIARVR
ncbi:MAG TPA: phosphatidylserine decarboxylase family protein [Thermoanaerobaculia bacterium]